MAPDANVHLERDEHAGDDRRPRHHIHLLRPGTVDQGPHCRGVLRVCHQQGASRARSTRCGRGIVLCEWVWGLGSGYRHPTAEILATVRSLLTAAQLRFEDVDGVRRGLARHEAGKGDFADDLLGERAVAPGCDRIATFDEAQHGEPEFFGQ